MSISVLGSNFSSGLACPAPGAGTPAVGDLIVFLSVNSITTPSVPSAVSGCGATWTVVDISSRTTVWIGTGATSIGTITATATTTSRTAAWWIRGTDPVLAAVWSGASASSGGTIISDPATAGPTQGVFVLAHANSSGTMPGASALPSGAAWTVTNSSGISRAYAAPATSAAHKLESFGSGQRTTMVQAVIGAPPPTAPTGLTLTPGLTNILTAWTAPTGTPATGYTVKVGAAAPLDVGNVTSYDATGLTSGTLYTIEVKAYNAGGSSAAVSDSATTLELPDPPTSLTQTAATSTTVDVGWVAPAAGPAPTSYERRTDGGTPVNVGLVTTAQITGLAPATAHTIEIRSVSAGGVSSWVSVEATTDEAPPAAEGSTDPRAWHITPESRRVVFLAEDRRWAIPPESRTLRMRTP